jgi:hypothetical protein
MSVSAESGALVERVSELINHVKWFAASQVNATLTLRNLYPGRMIDVAALYKDCAEHNKEVVAALGVRAFYL